MISQIRAANRRRRTVAVAIHASFLALAIVAAACSKPPAIEQGKQVSMLYEAKTIEGAVVDVNPEQGPLKFVVGTGMIQPKVEAKLIGMRAGEERTFAVEDAYGPYDEEKTGTLTRNALPDEPKVGDEIQMASGMTSKIKEIYDDHVVLDLNHPLAGKEIVFTVKIVDVGDPSPPS